MAIQPEKGEIKHEKRLPIARHEGSIHQCA
jgi:hypothetical protein